MQGQRRSRHTIRRSQQPALFAGWLGGKRERETGRRGFEITLRQHRRRDDASSSAGNHGGQLAGCQESEAKISCRSAMPADVNL